MTKTWSILALAIAGVALVSVCIDDDRSSHRNLKLKTVGMGGQALRSFQLLGT